LFSKIFFFFFQDISIFCLKNKKLKKKKKQNTLNQWVAYEAHTELAVFS